MKLRVPVVVVVLLMVLVSFSGISRNVSANDVSAAAPVPPAPVNGTANLTSPAPPSAPSGPAPATLTSSVPGGIVSGQTTYVYNFDTSNDGFTKTLY